MSITNNEIVQNSKSEPKKFSFLCTFKEAHICMSCVLHLPHFSHRCQLTKQNLPASHREESSFTQDNIRVCTSLKLCILRLHITVTSGFGCSSLIIRETWQERSFCKYLFRTLYPVNSIFSQIAIILFWKERI